MSCCTVGVLTQHTTAQQNSLCGPQGQIIVHPCFSLLHAITHQGKLSCLVTFHITLFTQVMRVNFSAKLENIVNLL